jgi:pSer/pThr/pTyr-binding forkhead associated (FHA) protein
MAKMILSMDGLVLKEILLTKPRLTFGRKPHNDIQIDNMAVSGEHAVVVTILSDSFLEDLNSTNGTLVNGRPVKKHFLKNGDVIEFSKYKLKYFSETDTQIQAAPFEEGPLPESGKPKAPPAPLSPSALATIAAPGVKPAVAEVALKRGGDATLGSTTTVIARKASADALPAAAVRLLNGPSTGRQLELTRMLTSLGKPGVQAAMIARKPHGYFILQAEGSSPPLLNGKPMSEPERLLKDCDVIELAGVKMEFFLNAG